MNLLKNIQVSLKEMESATISSVQEHTSTDPFMRYLDERSATMSVGMARLERYALESSPRYDEDGWYRSPFLLRQYDFAHKQAELMVAGLVQMIERLPKEMAASKLVGEQRVLFP